MNTNKFFDDISTIAMEIADSVNNTRYPRFIKKMKANRYMKKVFESLDKFKKTHCVFDTAMVFQLARLITNTFPGENTFGKITSIEIVEENASRNKDYRLLIMTVEDYDLIYKINCHSDSDVMDLSISQRTENDLSTLNYNNHCYRLHTKNRKYGDFVYQLNEILLNEAVKFFKIYIKNQVDSMV